MFCAIGNAASSTVKPPANSLRRHLTTFWSIKLLFSSNNYRQLNIYFVTKGEEKNWLPCRSHIITGSTEQETFLPFKLNTRKTNTSLPLLFFYRHSTVGIRSELFFSLPLAPCWSCSCHISSPYPALHGLSAQCYLSSHRKTNSPAKLLRGICSAGGQSCLSREGGCKQPRSNPLGKAAGENIPTYLLCILELDVEPTWLDHCLTSCPR